MKVYVAAPWTYRASARLIASKVEQAGHTITHDWWNHECGQEDYPTLTHLAGLDVKGVESADILLLLNFEKSEGKAVEQGIALKRGIPIIALGAHPTNIFQNLPCYTWVESVEIAIDLISKRA